MDYNINIMVLIHRAFSRAVPRVIALFILIAGLIFIPTHSAKSQGTSQLSLEGIDGASFPEMTLYFKARDSDGNVIKDLIPQELQVLENGIPVSVHSIAFEDPGLQIIVAVNPAPSLALYYGGITRYEQIRIALTRWAAEAKPENDDFSLTTTNGILATRLTSLKSWSELFQQFKPAFVTATPSLAALSQALDLAADPNPREYMERVILFITPLPLAGQINTLPDLISRATQLDTRVYVWLIGPSYAGDTIEARGLRQLADETGGSLFVFSGAEQLPDPESYFQQLRGIYRLQYTSALNLSGSHKLSIQWNQPGSSVISNELPFDVTIAAPNIVLLNPPREILREEKRMTNNSGIRLLPMNQVIQFIVEYPDGHPRPLVAARLYVDSVQVTENLTPPFEQLTWDLEEFDTSATHIVKIEAEDSLGLVGTTLETPIRLIITGRSKAAAAALTDRLTILFAVLIAGAALIMMLIFAGRRNFFSRNRLKSKEYQDPVTQPVIIHQEDMLDQKSAGIEPGSKPKYPARLIQVDEDSQPLAGGGVIPLDKEEYIFGSERRSAGIVLESPSVDAVHARLMHTEEGEYHLSDLGSVAGTWVNYAPISTSGIHLEHGDLIHIGKISFRFELSQPGPAKKSVITRLPKQ